MSSNILDKLKVDELPTALSTPRDVEMSAVSTHLANIVEATPVDDTTSSITTNVDNDDEVIIYQPPGHPKQAMIDGEVWPPIFKPTFVRSAKSLKPQSSDVFVVTYPKCGTTWIQHICAQLMSTDYGPEEGKELYLTSPMIERMGAAFVDNLKHPRLLKTHFNYQNCPHSMQAKYIYAVRNPKDCLMSYYFHNQLFNIYEFENGDFNTFYELFAEGKLGFGDYFNHLKSWLPHIYDDNVLFLTYEDMCVDMRTAIRKIGNFLGGNAARIVNDENSLSRIVEESGIDSMKKNQRRFFCESSLRKKDGFIQKGGSRNWKKHMTKAQSDRLDALFKEKLAGTIAESWWRYEMCWDNEAAEQIALTEEPSVSSPFAVSSTIKEQMEQEKYTYQLSRRNSVHFSTATTNATSVLGSIEQVFRKRAASCIQRPTPGLMYFNGIKMLKLASGISQKLRKSPASFDSNDSSSSSSSSTLSLTAIDVTTTITK